MFLTTNWKRSSLTRIEEKPIDSPSESSLKSTALDPAFRQSSAVRPMPLRFGDSLFWPSVLQRLTTLSDKERGWLNESAGSLACGAPHPVVSKIAAIIPSTRILNIL